MWVGRKVLVTGGASFIGSHLVDALVERHADIKVVDDLSSGQLKNIQHHIDDRVVTFRQGDLKDPDVAREVLQGMEVVFHLAADHGGRGYVDVHQAACSTNLLLDALVFKTAHEQGVQKVVYASSGCVYPNYLQSNPSQELYLTEDMAGPPYDADNLYGWAKLMAELTLKAYHNEYGLKAASCRYFTVYGPRGVENHAVIAMIARAFVKQDPFVVWGTGEQIRNWTYIEDIVEGTILAAERIEDASAVNLGTMERIRVADAAAEILRLTGHEARLEFHPEMPTGPYNRVADNRRAKELLNWEPQVRFFDGLRRTVEWYFSHKRPEQIETQLPQMLVER